MKTICFLLALAPAISEAQTVNEVLENYFRAIGGKEKIACVEATREISKNWFRRKPGDLPDSLSMVKTMTILKHPYYKLFISYDQKGKPNNEFYYNEKGSVLAMGDVIQESKNSSQIQVCIAHQLLIDYSQYKLDFLGQRELNGLTFNVVRTNSQPEQHFYFDIENFLLSATSFPEWKDRTTYYSDYRQTNLILHPFKQESKDQNSTYYLQISQSFEFNPKIEKSTFIFNKAEYEKRNESRQKYKSVTLQSDALTFSEFFIKNFDKKRVFVDLWATWCGPCKREFKTYDSSFYSLLAQNKLEVLYVSIDKDKKKWEADVKKLGLKGSHVLANDSMLQFLQTELFGNGPFVIPRYLIVDERGVIIYKEFARPSDPEFKALIIEQAKK